MNGTSEALFVQPTRVSESGRYLELMSQASPTGYDNRDRATSQPVAEVYLFDATENKLVCASCLSSGERPVGVEYQTIEPGNGGLAGGPRDIWPAAELVAANVPGWTVEERSPRKTLYQPRYLDDSGRLFFNSADGLVAEDSNKTEDVYEYEPPGVGGPPDAGGCSEGASSYEPSASGCVALISSGSSPQESAFLDASESGDDVFFLTSAQLSKADEDNAPDVYDAHVCSDSPCITYTRSEPSNCAGEECKPPQGPQPQIFGAPPSQTFSGPGNLLPAPVKAAPKPKTAEQLRVERLNKALKACRAKKNKQKREACEKSARKRYAKPQPKAKKKSKPKAKKK